MRLEAMQAQYRQLEELYEAAKPAAQQVEAQRIELKANRHEIAEALKDLTGILATQGYYSKLTKNTKFDGRLKAWTCQLRNRLLGGLWPEAGGSTALAAMRHAIQERDYIVDHRLRVYDPCRN